MKSTRNTSVQPLGNGAYRVGRINGRSPITGRFIIGSKSAAERELSQEFALDDEGNHPHNARTRPPQPFG